MNLDLAAVLSNVGIIVVSVIAIVADHHTINLIAKLMLKITKGQYPKRKETEHHDPEDSTIPRPAMHVSESTSVRRIERERCDHERTRLSGLGSDRIRPARSDRDQ